VFSNRTPGDLGTNRLANAVVARRREGLPLVDLTESNPTRAGFAYAPDLLAPLASVRGLSYRPSPFGLPEARAAVAADYARRGFDVAVERIVLTASTSEAYSLLFKLLCDPGDEVLVPRPSYPLFDHLTQLDAVISRPYDLEYHGTWSIELGSVERALTPRTRAVLIVSPNNPTGSFVSEAELDQLARLCAGRGIAIIADEVFADYELAPGAARAAARVLDRLDVLAFSLGGLSKSAGLPQVKLGWMAAAGPPAALEQALRRLEFVCDTYLSVSTPVQIAAAGLIERGAAVRVQIQARIAANYRELTLKAVKAPACQVLRADGGWYAVLQVPTLASEEDVVVRLVEDEGLLTHPGYFFDFRRESYLILSLLVPEAAFAEAVARLFRHFDCTDAVHDR
jgi:alanine-synthesizing transaminase